MVSRHREKNLPQASEWLDETAVAAKKLGPGKGHTLNRGRVAEPILAPPAVGSDGVFAVTAK